MAKYTIIAIKIITCVLYDEKDALIAMRKAINGE